MGPGNTGGVLIDVEIGVQMVGELGPSNTQAIPIYFHLLTKTLFKKIGHQSDQFVGDFDRLDDLRAIPQSCAGRRPFVTVLVLEILDRSDGNLGVRPQFRQRTGVVLGVADELALDFFAQRAPGDLLFVVALAVAPLSPAGLWRWR